MDPELLINSPESDEDLFDIGYPPSSGQQTDPSQASERSRVCSAFSAPHTSRYRSRSSSPNEIPPTPDRSQASSTPPARANNRRHNRHSQLQSPHHRQPASFTAPGHSQQRTRHASRTEPRSEMEPELRRWAVIQLQRFLKENGIHFHRNDNKARLFNLYKAYSSTTARTTRHTALPAPEPTTARRARTPRVVTSQASVLLHGHSPTHQHPLVGARSYCPMCLLSLCLTCRSSFQPFSHPCAHRLHKIPLHIHPFIPPSLLLLYLQQSTATQLLLTFLL